MTRAVAEESFIFRSEAGDTCGGVGIWYLFQTTETSSNVLVVRMYESRGIDGGDIKSKPRNKENVRNTEMCESSQYEESLDEATASERETKKYDVPAAIRNLDP